MMDDLISVVVPVYNASKYIGSAIQSILNQTYKRIEIIVVDDCSTDDTGSKLLEHKEYIKIVRHEKNLGVASARNTGIELCRGALVAFLDGDDIWVPEKLEIFAESFSKHEDILFAFSDFSRFEWADRAFFSLTNSQISPDIYKLIEYQKYVDRKFFLISKKEMFSLLLGGYPIAPSTMVVKKRIFDSIGLWRNKLLSNEDFDFSLKSCRFTDFIYIDEPLTSVGRCHHGLSADILRHRQGDLAVFDLHLEDTSYNKDERDLIKYHKGRRLCGLGYSYHRSGDIQQALEKYLEGMRYKRWFWHALWRIGYISFTGFRKKKMPPSARR